MKNVNVFGPVKEMVKFRVHFLNFLETGKMLDENCKDFSSTLLHTFPLWQLYRCILPRYDNVAELETDRTFQGKVLS